MKMKTMAQSLMLVAALGLSAASQASESITESEIVSASTLAATTPVINANLPDRAARICPNSKMHIYIGADIFATGSAVPHPAEMALLKEALRVEGTGVGVDNYVWIRIRSHADSRGSEAYNLNLSAQRSAALEAALTSAGAPARTMHIVNYGELRPEYTNQTAAGRQMNRSSVVEIYSMDRRMTDNCLANYPNAIDPWKD